MPPSRDPIRGYGRPESRHGQSCRCQLQCQIGLSRGWGLGKCPHLPCQGPTRGTTRGDPVEGMRALGPIDFHTTGKAGQSFQSLGTCGPVDGPYRRYQERSAAPPNFTYSNDSRPPRRASYPSVVVNNVRVNHA